MGNTTLTDEIREPPSRRRRSTRERLLDAAYEVFAREGVGSASLDTIAKQAGFTRGAFYSNFATKDDLLAALAVRENERRMRQLVEGRDALENNQPEPLRDLPVRELVTASVEEFLEWQQEDSDWLIVEQEIRLLAMRDNAFGNYQLGYRAKVDEVLQNVLEHVLATRGMQFIVDPRLATQMIVAVYIDATITDAMGRAASDELRQTLTELILRITSPASDTELR